MILYLNFTTVSDGNDNRGARVVANRFGYLIKSHACGGSKTKTRGVEEPWRPVN